MTTIVLCLAVPSVAAAGAVEFAAGRARVIVPLGYTHRVEADGSLLLMPPRPDLFAFRLGYDDLARHREARPNLAIEIVVDAAARKQRPLTRIDGTRYLGFVEPGGISRRDGETWRNLQGSIAAGGGLLDFTLTIPERHAASAEVQAFVGGGMEQLLATVEPAAT
ncbi:MAG: hypothetical protein JNK67_06205 [Alphaproteobacteria bacterium]|nr:hypothetical protein [Alphaproteobacteria bacterium]